MTDPAMILHIGAPKCGSSAVQTALTMQPDQRDAQGRLLRYVALRKVGGRYRPVYGRMMRRLADVSPYGYLSCPNFGRHVEAATLSDGIRSVCRAGQAGGWTPVLSCEGWINHPDHFAGMLADLGHPPVQVVAFLRPPVEWVNAAWWQWGIWSFPHVAAWLKRGLLTYRFAADLEAWQRIPNLRLEVRRARPDAVAKFADLCAIAPDRHPVSNVSSPASLIGFLLRNRRFRPTAHDAQTEFVFQRWCPPVPGGGLWALNPAQIRDLRPVTAQSTRILTRILPDAARDDLFADAGWQDEATYHPALQRGLTQPHAPEDLPALYAALSDGVTAAEGAGRALPEPPDGGASVAQWDPVLATLLDRLLAADAQARRRGVLGTALGWGDDLVQRFRS